MQQSAPLISRDVGLLDRQAVKTSKFLRDKYLRLGYLLIRIGDATDLLHQPQARLIFAQRHFVLFSGGSVSDNAG